MLAPSLQQFSLRAEMLPSYIPARVAEKILFVGESVQMFENQNQNPSRSGETHTCTHRHRKKLKALQRTHCTFNHTPQQTP